MAEKWKTNADSGSCTFLSFSCFSTANQEAVSRSAALLLRIKALALQKRPLFVLFVLAGTGCHNIMHSRGWAVQNKGITLKTKMTISGGSDNFVAVASLDVLTASKNVVNLVENRTVNFVSFWIRINKVDPNYSYLQNLSLVVFLKRHVTFLLSHRS